MTKPKGCSATAQGDQWSCSRCKLLWDMNDPDPPVCLPKAAKRQKARLPRPEPKPRKQKVKS